MEQQAPSGQRIKQQPHDQPDPPPFPASFQEFQQRTNVPLPLTSFIGRQHELAEIPRILADARLVTLTGIAGIGKTRLAQQIALQLIDTYPDGVWFVELAPISDPALVPQTVLGVFGVRKKSARPPMESLFELLRAKQLLLILDNCERLLSACAQLVEELLLPCPQLRILATSREMLGVSGEVTYPVPPLAVPDYRQPVLPDSLLQIEAAQLFVERARALVPSFTLTEQNAPRVAEICARLDGLPLALELAAARVRIFPVEQIAARLDRRFRLLSESSRTALPRHRILRALVDWSYDLLSLAEQRLFRRLSVFVGSWSLEVAQAVCAGEGIEEDTILDLLPYLVEKSLVIAEPDEEGALRYRMLEILREYARERLIESGELEATQRRHAVYYLALVRSADQGLVSSEQADWLRRLESEHDNLRAALRWAIEHREAELGLRLGGTLWRFWYMHGYLTEGQQWLMKLLSLPANVAQTLARAQALNGAGNMAYKCSDYATARMLHEEGLAIARDKGYAPGVASSLNNLGLIARAQADYAQSQAFYEEALALNRSLGNRFSEALNLNNLGNVLYDRGDYPAAQACQQESVAIYRSLNNPWGTAMALCDLGNALYAQGDVQEARSCYEQSLALRQEIGDNEGVALSLHYLGIVARDQGDDQQAVRLLSQSLSMRRQFEDRRDLAATLLALALVMQEQGDESQAIVLLREGMELQMALGTRLGAAQCLEASARILAGNGSATLAVQCLGAAQAIRESIGAPLPPMERDGYQRTLASLRDQLGEAAFDAAWAEGYATDPAKALASVLDELRIS
ncbi:MAG: serine/threonine protein kinase [Herpetosiphonaceae bacterium]|nr:MAG: serine/threonine protein kinase [Herpetosiphonaceae bacterium]